MKNKKSQNETVGFVLIVLIVVIIGVIFLGFKVREQNPNIATDAEISNFLVASGEYTTGCYLNAIPEYRRLKDLEKDCYYRKTEQIICPNNFNPCQMLNKTYSDMLLEFRPGGKVLSYYKLSFYYSLNSEGEVQKMPFGNVLVYGNQTGCITKRGGRAEISGEEDYSKIITEIEVCEAEF